MSNLPYISEDLVKSYKTNIEATNSPATAKRKVASLKKFFNWAHAEGHSSINPTEFLKVQKPKTQIQFPASINNKTIKKPSKYLNTTNLIRALFALGLTFTTFAILSVLKIPIPFIPSPASNNLVTISDPDDREEVPANLLPSSTPTLSPSPKPTSTPLATIQDQNEDNLTQPSGNDSGSLSGFGGLIEADSITLSTTDLSDGDININPDGSGNLNLIFEGNAGNMINATAANLNSGSLYYGYVGNNSTSYNLLLLQSGSPTAGGPTTRFSVDALGNTKIAGNLTEVHDVTLMGNLIINGKTRFSSTGKLDFITGYFQEAGTFDISQGTSDWALIHKTLNNTTGKATREVLKLELNESEVADGSSEDTLIVTRQNAKSDGYAIYVPEGNVRFDADLGIGENLTANSATFNNSLTLYGTANFSGQSVYSHSPTLPHTGTWAIGSATWNQDDAAIYINPASATADSNLFAIAVGDSVVFDIDAEGDIYARNLILTGSTSTGSTTVAGDLTVEGNTTLGDAGTDTLTFTASVAQDSDLVPLTVAGTNDLGASSLPWDNLYIATSITTSDDSFIGLGSGAGRIEFDDQTTDEVNILNANVGIGTTGPTSSLHITSDSQSSVRMDTFNDTATTNSELLFTRKRGTQASELAVNTDDRIGSIIFRGFNGTSNIQASSIEGFVEDSANTAGNLVFKTRGSSGSSTERLRITGNGNVGIGDTTPDYKLELHDATTTPTFALSDDDIAHGVTTLAETDVFYHLSSISTTVGGAQLTGLADATGTALLLKGIQSSDPTDTTPAISLIAAKASGTGIVDLGDDETVLQIGNNDNTAALTVLGSGEVGIGTSAPNVALEVYGRERIALDSTSASLHPNNSLFSVANSGNGTYTNLGNFQADVNGPVNGRIYNQNTSSNSASAWQIGGRTGTGDVQLDIFLAGSNSYAFGIDNSDSDKLKISYGSSGSATFGTNDYLTIDTTGLVGIGTTGPDAPLDVLSTAGAQMRLTYTDGSVYTNFTTSSGGDLTVAPTGGDTTFSTRVIINSGDSSNSHLQIRSDGNTNIRLLSQASLSIGTNLTSTSSVNGSIFAVDPYPANGTSLSNVKLFRNVNTTGRASLDIAIADSTDTVNTSFAGTGNSYIAANNGNLGIGATAPDAKLEINHATGDNLRLTYNDADGSATAFTDFSLASDGDLTIESAGNNISLGVGDVLAIPGITSGTVTNSVCVNSSSQLITCTDGGTGSGDITAVGNIASGDAFTSGVPGGELYFADNGFLGLGSGAGRIEFDDQTTDEVNILNANIGIGTGTPGAKVDIVGNGNTSATTSLLITGSSALTLFTVRDDRNIGINISSPESTLDIRDTGGTDVDVRLVGNGSGDPILKLWRSATNRSANIRFGTGSTDQWFMGYLGTGTANTVFSLGSSNSLASSIFAVTTSGTVGIGTTAPDAALEINHATGDSLRLTYNDSDGSATAYTDFSLSSTGGLTLTGSAASVASGASAEKTFLTLTPATITLTGTTQVTSLMDSYLFSRATIAGDTATVTVDDAATLTIEGPPAEGTNVSLTEAYGLKINAAATTATTAYGLYVDAPTGAGSNYGAIFASGNVGIGTATPESQLTIGSTSLGSFNGLAIGAAADRDIRIGQASGTNLILGWAYNATPASASGKIETFGLNNPLVIRGSYIALGGATESLRASATELAVNENSANVDFRVESDNLVNALFVEGTNGTVGIGTSVADAALEINHATGDNLRLTYNDSDGSATNYTDFSLDSTGALTLTGSAASVASGASAEKTFLTLTPATITLTGTTQVTSLMDTYLINRATIAGDTATVTVDEAATLTIAGPPAEGTNVSLAEAYGLKINTAATTATTAYGLYVDAPTGAGSNYGAIFASGNVGIGTSTPTLGKLQVTSGGQSTYIDSAGGSGVSLGSSGALVIRSANDTYNDATNHLFRSQTGGTEYARINSSGQLGIGDSGPDYLLELHDATTTPTFALSDDDIAHGVTTLAETDVFFHLSSISTTVGGAQLTGLADATGIALGLKGIQSSDPTDTTPAISLIAAKASGTGVVDLGAAETVFQVANNDDTAAITVLGSGNVGIGTATPNARLSITNNVATGFLDNYSEYQEILHTGADAVSSYGFGIVANTMVFNSGAGAYNFDRNGNTTAMAIETSGDVGIATTAPDARLEINHATGDVLRLTYNDSNGSATAYTDFSLASDGDLTVDSAGGMINFSDSLVVTGNINPEADGTRNLGTQTTAQWANVWADLVNGADFAYLNSWRSLESDKYSGYPQGIAFGNQGFASGVVTEKMDTSLKPSFAVTNEFIEYQGFRLTPSEWQNLDNLSSNQKQNQSVDLEGTLNFILDNISEGTLTVADFYTNKIIVNVVSASEIVASNIKAGSLIASEVIVEGTLTASNILSENIVAGAVSVDSFVTNTLVAESGNIANFVSKNIVAGAITTTEFTTDSAVAFTATIDNLLITTGLVSPSVKTNTIASIEQGEAITIGSDTEVHGNLTAETLEVEGAATVAGTLYADRIVADIPEDPKIAEIEALLKDVEVNQKFLAEMAASTNLSEESIDGGALSTLSLNELFVTGQAAINSLSISESISLSDLVIASSSTPDPVSSINTLTAPLSLQSLALAPIELMAGKIKINTSGDAEFLGNVNIAGNLKVEGESRFGTLQTDKLIIASQGETLEALEDVTTENTIETNATAGKATIKEGETEMVIKNPTVTDNTLIYITPTSSTGNQVLFVKSKESGQFMVGFNDPTETKVEFNWWIIEVQQ